MDIEEMRRLKKALGMTNQELSCRSGVPLSTVAKILGGTTAAPRIDTVRALEAALRAACSGREKTEAEGRNSHQDQTQYRPVGSEEDARFLTGEPDYAYIYGSNAEKRPDDPEEENDAGPGLNAGPGSKDAEIAGPITMPGSPSKRLHGYKVLFADEVREIESASQTGLLSREPLHTIEDYLALPDERRVELIDGRFYDMAAPNGVHQQIVLLLWMTLYQCIEEHGMPCKAQAAPFDVQLDDYTIVEPDVMVFCQDPSQAFAIRATTPPDLVIEVLSKSTALKDRHLKLFKYRVAGVRELWLVSPKKQTVEVYLFDEDREDPETYTFDDTIPVRISDGLCSVDFSEIRKRLPDNYSD